MSNDLINGLFELGGALAVCLSIRELIRDKCYAGLSVWNLLFFNGWGIWNTYFYTSLDQYWSFLGGLALVAANSGYLFCVWYFPHHKLKADEVPEEYKSQDLSLKVDKKYKNGFGCTITIKESPGYLLPGEFMGNDHRTYLANGKRCGLFNYDPKYDLIKEINKG